MNQIYRIVICVILFGITALNAEASDNLIVNGDFQKFDEKNLPTGWKVGLNSKMDLQVKVVPGSGPLGSNALYINNKTVYGGGRCPIRIFPKLKAGQTYEISLRAHGNTGGFLSIALGNKWQQRMWIKGAEKGWKKYSKQFVATKEHFAFGESFEVCLLNEDKCEAYITDIKLVPVNSLMQISEAYSDKNSFAIIPKIDNFSKNINYLPKGLPEFKCEVIDKITPEFAYPIGRGYLAYDEEGLIFFGRVKDTKHFTRQGDNMWNGDCIQIVVAPAEEDTENEHSSKRFEIGFTEYDGKPDNYCWTEKRHLTEDEMTYNVRVVKGGYIVAARLSWNLIGDLRNTEKGFSFNMTVNSSDDGTNRNGVSLAPGIYNYKSNKDNVNCYLEEKLPKAEFIVKSKKVTSALGGRLFVKGPAENCVLEVKDSKGSYTYNLNDKSDNLSKKLTTAYIDIPAEEFAPGPITATLLEGDKVLVSREVTKADFYGDAQKSLAAVLKRFAKIKPTLEKYQKLPRVKAFLAIFERQKNLLGNDLKKSKTQEQKDYYGERGLRIARELNDLCDYADAVLADLKNGKKPPAEKHYISSEKNVKDGFVEATVKDDSGKKSVTPYIFSGYGHFGQASRDVPVFNSFGADMIQFEVTLRGVITGENPDGSFIVSYKDMDSRFRALNNGWKNNVAVCLLLGTHYMPTWMLKNHPEMKWNSGSFLQFDVQHPVSRKMLEVFIRKTVEHAKAQPGAKAIHSICLSNEPSYRPSLTSEFTRKRFINYLKDKFNNNIRNMSETHGKNYKSFEEAVPTSDPSSADAPAMFYDYYIFKLDETRDWHAWMANIVHDVWPEMPVHSKTMYGLGLATSVDLERFSEFSNLNGTDSSLSYNQRKKTYRPDAEITYGLHKSFLRASIVNGENHIIPDDVEEYVSYDEVYTAIFQQFAQGVAASCAWVWEEYGLAMFKQHHVFVGDIYRRPMGIMAVRDASADANRMVEEIKAAFLEQEKIAILYSVPSMIQDKHYTNVTQEVWRAMRRTGYRVRFISEKQLAENKIDDIKLILMPNVKFMDEDGYAGLKRFIDNGGKAVNVGPEFKPRNPCGKPLYEKLDVESAGFDDLKSKAQQVVGDLPVNVEFDAEKIDWWLSRTGEGEYLINILNYGDTSQEISISDPGYEMISCKQIPAGKLMLKRFKPMMLKVKVK